MAHTIRVMDVNRETEKAYRISCPMDMKPEAQAAIRKFRVFIRDNFGGTSKLRLQADVIYILTVKCTPEGLKYADKFTLHLTAMIEAKGSRRGKAVSDFIDRAVASGGRDTAAHLEELMKVMNNMDSNGGRS